MANKVQQQKERVRRRTKRKQQTHFSFHTHFSSSSSSSSSSSFSSSTSSSSSSSSSSSFSYIFSSSFSLVKNRKIFNCHLVTSQKEDTNQFSNLRQIHFTHITFLLHHCRRSLPPDSTTINGLAHANNPSATHGLLWRGGMSDIALDRVCDWLAQHPRILH